MSIEISVCMIVRDEELTLGRALDCVKSFADEIIIVDTGSKDATLDVAKKYTENIHHFDWIDDFAAARNFSFSKATRDFIMWLDADDMITEEDQLQILQLKEELHLDINMVTAQYATGFDEDGAINFKFARERFLNRRHSPTWVGQVHEIIPLAGTVVDTEIVIEHRKVKPRDVLRNVTIYEKMSNEKNLDARETYYFARELYDIGDYQKALKMFASFIDMEGNLIDKQDALAIQDDIYKRVGADAKHRLASLNRCHDFGCSPKATLACLIADCHFELNQVDSAKHWYRFAMEHSPRVGFIDEKYYNEYPSSKLAELDRR